MASTISARKAKGRSLQKELVLALRRRYGLDLEPNMVDIKQDCYEGDITARVLGATGTDIVLSPSAQLLIPFSIECKAQESLNIWQAMKQAEDNTKPSRTALLAFKRNRTETYCCLKLTDLLRLIK